MSDKENKPLHFVRIGRCVHGIAQTDRCQVCDRNTINAPAQAQTAGMPCCKQDADSYHAELATPEPSQPAMYDTTECRCGRIIVWLGTYWWHDSDRQMKCADGVFAEPKPASQQPASAEPKDWKADSRKCLAKGSTNFRRSMQPLLVFKTSHPLSAMLSSDSYRQSLGATPYPPEVFKVELTVIGSNGLVDNNPRESILFELHTDAQNLKNMCKDIIEMIDHETECRAKQLAESQMAGQ